MNDRPKTISLTIEILGEKRWDFLEAYGRMDELQKVGKPVPAEVIRKFLNSFVTRMKLDSDEREQKKTELMTELFSEFASTKYNFSIRQEDFVIHQILPDGSKKRVRATPTEYSLQAVAAEIYLNVLYEIKEKKLEKPGDIIKWVYNRLDQYMQKIKKPSNKLTKYRMNVIAGFISAQMGALMKKDDFLDSSTKGTYWNYLFHGSRYYTERQDVIRKKRVK